jgi:hypothetical protein
MKTISIEHLDNLQKQKQFELDFLTENWPADPFGGVWLNEDLVSPEVVRDCFAAQELISADFSRFSVGSRQCARRDRGRVAVRVNSFWWNTCLAVAGS